MVVLLEQADTINKPSPDKLRDSNAGLWYRESDTPDEVVSAAITYHVGKRFQSKMTLSELLNGNTASEILGDRSFGDLDPTEKQKYIGNAEGIGVIGSKWKVTEAKFPYDINHIMIIGAQEYLKNISNNGGSPQIPDEDLALLFSSAGETIEKLMTIPDYDDVQEWIFGINAQHNKSLPFLHAHLVGMSQNRWSRIGFEGIPERAPHREKLMQENIGRREPDLQAAEDIVASSNGLARGGIAVNAGASAYIPMSGSIGEVMSDSRFIEFFRGVDTRLRTSFEGDSDVRPCIAFNIIAKKDLPYALLVFQTAVKLGDKPSGIIEAAGYMFEDPNIYGEIETPPNDVQEEHDAHSLAIADLLSR